MSVLHLLEGPPVGALLQKATVYRYALNKPVFGIAIGFAVLCAIVVGLLVWKTELDEGAIIATLVLSAIGAVFYGIRAAYWYDFVQKGIIAFTDNVFIIGNEDKAWVLDWSILTPETMGIEKMVLTRMGASFQVQVAGESIKVPLYGAMFYLLDLEKFMGDILARVHIDGDQED